MEVDQLRYIHLEIRQTNHFFCGHYSFCPLEKDLEILGSIALQIFLVAGSSEPLLYG